MAFDRINQIKNPLVRTGLAAWVGLTAGAMIAGAVVGFKAEKNDADFKAVGYVALVAAALGGVYGLGRSPKPDATEAKSSQTLTWPDWRPFVVARKVKESAEITSFYLKPQEGEPLPSFSPGQFLTIKLDIPGQPRPVIRTYSLSDYRTANEYYRLSIKREQAPKGHDVPPGVASNYMHDYVHEGTVILAKPPNGKFVLDVSQTSPVVLISNGVGITPMISMVKAVCHEHPTRHVWFLHGARNGEFHAFRDEIGAIAHEFPNVHVYYRYSQPRPEDKGQYHGDGYVDTEMLKSLIAPEIEQETGAVSETDYFLCGSPGFMDSLRNGLSEWGVPKDKVAFEAFSQPNVASKEPTSVDEKAIRDGKAGIEVMFEKSGVTAVWTPDQGTLLEFAEAQGLNPDYSCRAGICLTCMCAIKDGEVEYDEPPTGTPDEGTVLICVSKPKTDRVILEL
ncbi:MAG: 2Fe-2S iron-sulfur cluster-binding protein [Leptolyngbyaceae bacterium]|nr:2Fe-2S iron-sulfur cluster-binding protein [Leptolyngbyaceae bacterium]